ncbi:MAG: hydroxymethylbilane synthase [Hornefia sp.]|nr:hydroxymethylbilane synthase [Hornefia sp.]
MRKKLVIATRGSKLALAQAHQVQDELKKINVDTEILVVHTKGDKDRNSALKEIGGDGLFVREIEKAILAGEADIAVHSGKDLPYNLADGLVIAGVSKAADCRDCLISAKGKEELNIIGTGSPRRILEYKRANPDAKFREIRGNITTRLRKLHDGECDAVILAAAGLRRLNIDLSPYDVHEFSAEEMMPAACQGIIAIECRQEDSDVVKAVRKMTHRHSWKRFNIERRLFRIMEADCSMAVGIHAEVDGDKLILSAMFEGRRVEKTGTYLNGEKLCAEIKKEIFRGQL